MSKSLTVLYGKFRIIHRGHEDLINFATNIAKKNEDYPAIISSNTSGCSFHSKVVTMKTMFPEIRVDVFPRGNMVSFLRAWGDANTHLTIVCGADRYYDYLRLTKLYNRSDFNFKSIDIKVLERKESSISSTKMEKFLKENDKESFLTNLPDCITNEYKHRYFLEKVREYGCG